MTVHLHVGVPHAGTTYLSASLGKNRKALRSAGVLYLRGRGGVDDVDDVARRVRRHDGVSVVGHELLASAGARQAAAAMTMFAGLEVHVVVTVRDPARQAVDEWQDGVRRGQRLSFEQFRRQPSGVSELEHSLPDVLARWQPLVPRHRLHVVCCPPVSTPGVVLWQRFAAVVGFDPADIEPVLPGALAPSLGTDETDLLRRVNIALDGRLGPRDHAALVGEGYARRLLRLDPARPAVPADLHDDLTVVAERWAKEIDGAGHPVHGDVSDLYPVAAPATAPHPDRVHPRAQVETAAAATADLLVELSHARREIARLEKDRSRQRKVRKQLRRRLGGE